jgi:hypothetical protein
MICGLQRKKQVRYHMKSDRASFLTPERVVKGEDEAQSKRLIAV